MSSSNQVEYTSSYSIPYSPLSYLNTLDVHIPVALSKSTTQDDARYWIIYIHGGAWRDPDNTSKDILQCLPYLSPMKYRIGGISSVNYRLTKYLGHKTNPNKPDDSARDVTHPTHIEDILTAIQWLQHKYEFGSRYVIAGHSCGATLAFQAVMGIWTPRKELETVRDFILPDCVIGFEGIYDLALFLKTHSEIPIYRSFLEDAFGVDQSKWPAASPIHGQFSRTWPNGKVVLLAQSPEDELVDWVQTSKMGDHLWEERTPGRNDGTLKLRGSHRSVWFHGEELAKGFHHALEMLKESST